MEKFTYTIKDELGIHARPAGMLAKKAKEFKSVITIEMNGKSANLEKLMAVMGMGVKHGDTVTITSDGADEIEASSEMKKFLSENL